jgi:hypothetical protein
MFTAAFLILQLCASGACGIAASPTLAAPAATPQTPEGSPEDITLDPMVESRCDRYLERRRQGEPGVDKLYWYWGAGLMAGLNTARLLSGLDARKLHYQVLSLNVVTATMVAYCEQHPQDGYGFGVTWQIFRRQPLIPGSQQDWQRRRGG